MILFQHLVDNTVKKLRSQIANVLTIINLGLGGFAIIYVLQGQYHFAVLFICLAAIFDRFDGQIARKLNITSSLGKQLDSLCDLISFGVAPALLLYQSTVFEFGIAGSIFTIIFIACGAIRLARFAISEQEGFFIGLPITAAGCILTLSHLMNAMITPPVFMFLILSLSLLMISNFRVKKV
ncbi:CDP-diacylglycerol--serine O-phosphatidyltransferase [Evansella cellulosilytica]|uniref:CDP-diacylglycerol--serine O-phosphatidyltransferase n=1 Tax=Evansella cellulosilytica (strain ATCC 21833 / DSM 2522 / FERM P-1141 / JCM 9156 / N-4) TaxID=649639 RepID=E6TVZ6_EVAC2|nr:CDP-diacylglycerol--serine O-phosphatidyltransferase [Evansella cellulosilytica]ADU29819.1 CDP-diacylglycerol/serine O-phosphatidyltransferase [Evansella cellulosilytica DSM 2522]